MRRILAIGLLAFAGCYGGESTSALPADIVVKSGPTVTVNESTNTICVSADLAGLGMNDVNVDMMATFAATTVCRNNGGNTAPGQGTIPLNVTFPTQSFEPKNGRVHFTACSAPISGSDFPVPSSHAAGCPNGNWTVDPIATSAITIASYTVTLTWSGQQIFTQSGP